MIGENFKKLKEILSDQKIISFVLGLTIGLVLVCILNPSLPMSVAGYVMTFAGINSCEDCNDYFVNITGDTMKGDLDMKYNKITDVNKLDANEICLNGECISDFGSLNNDSGSIEITQVPGWKYCKYLLIRQTPPPYLHKEYNTQLTTRFYSPC